MAAESLIESFCDEFSTIAPFDQVERDLLRWLAQQAELAYYPAGTVICQAAQVATALFLIKDGRVGSRSSEGEVGDYGKGDAFPIAALLTGQALGFAQEALDDSFIYRLPISAFEALRQQSVAFSDYCLDRMGHLLVSSRQALQAKLLQETRHVALNMTLGQIMSPVITCAPDCSLLAALEQMQHARIGSMLVADADGRPLGIYTLQDLLATVLAKADLHTAITDHMHAPLQTLGRDALAADAAVLMARHRIRHIPVVEQGRLTGMVSERDLYGLQRVNLGSIERLLSVASTDDEFAEVTSQIRHLTVNLLAQGLAAEPLARLISTLYDRMTARLVSLKLAALQGGQLCWLVFGSEGRQEQTFSTDQDNGVVFQVPEGQTADSVRADLLPLCEQVNRVLDHCGITLCKGGIMAMNPACCLSLAEWEARFAQWVDAGNPDSLLAATIFFDLRPIWGDEALADSLHDYLEARIRERPRFLWLLTRNALLHEPPLGLLREFVTQKRDGKPVLDLKSAGTVFFVDAARLLALAAGVRSVATCEEMR